MAYAKPVVASRIGGIPEFVRHGRTGLLSEPKDATERSTHVRTLLDNPDLRGRFGMQARRVVDAEYSLERHAATLLSLYESLVPLPEARINQIKKIDGAEDSGCVRSAGRIRHTLKSREA